MKKSGLLAAVCAITLGILTPTTHAAVINPIIGLDIAGTLYDVIFHDQPDDSFNELWDADDDGVFGGGGSLFSTAPTFWGNELGAIDAATAIMQALGDVHATTAVSGTGRDGFMVPWAVTTDIVDCAAVNYIPGPQYVCAAADNTALLVDAVISGSTGRLDDDTFLIGFFPYASFLGTSVPIPAAAWLFASGLIGLIGVARSVDLHSKLTHLPPIFASKIDPRVNPLPLTERWEIKRSDKRGFIECNPAVAPPGEAGDPGDYPTYRAVA